MRLKLKLKYCVQGEWATACLCYGWSEEAKLLYRTAHWNVTSRDGARNITCSYFEKDITNATSFYLLFIVKDVFRC
jgi:hypothetical protein